MGDEIEDHLKANARAFESLLSLHPAKLYHGEDTSDQWQRKKQTKEERYEARKAKLDPNNIRTAKDIMDEKERKRKRELGEEFESIAENQDNHIKAPRKRQRSDGAIQQDVGNETEDLVKKRKEKRQQKLERRQKKREKEQAREETRQSGSRMVQVSRSDNSAAGSEEKTEKIGDIEAMDISGLQVQSIDEPISPITDSPAIESTVSSDQPAIPSSTSSPPASDPPSNDSLQLTTKPKVDHSVLQARLRARIEALRAARKADGPDGKPARSRAELIEARRQKALAKRAHKKELWKQQKHQSEAEAKIAAEAELARLRGSGSPLTSGFLSPIMTPDTEKPRMNFTFGRVQFDDGSRLSLTNELMEAKKSRGAMDTKARLTMAEKKQEKLNELDEDKRQDIEDKDAWLAARRKVSGGKVRDDVSLLKRTLKRREKQKAKSEKEWKSREDGVRRAEETKQRKREENLAKRRDEKKRGKANKGGKVKKKSGDAAAMKRAKFRAFGSSKPRA